MADFFISYTSADQTWAEWISYVLEEEGFTVIIQAWDFRPGSNFILEMQRAAIEADRTIMVLSPDYLKSEFASPEWAAALVQDPKGLERKLLPVIVRQCQPRGLLTM
jgi:TIR domain